MDLNLYKSVLLAICAVVVLNMTFALAQFNTGGAPTFPPEPVTGPFPTGMEPVRNDAPIDTTGDWKDSGIVHEYTCYSVGEPPVIDGEIDNDPVWMKIPWTVFPFVQGDPSFSIFSGQTNDLWDDFENNTAWWKMLWDGGENVYFALEVVDDFYNPIEEPENEEIHAWDVLQLRLSTAAPGDTSTPDDTGFDMGVGVTDWNGYWEEVLNNWSWPGHSFARSDMILAEGDNDSGNSTTDGKAIHASVEEKDDYWIYRFEWHFVLDSSMQAHVVPDAVMKIGMMFLDHDTNAYRGVCWASLWTGWGSLRWTKETPPVAEVKNQSFSGPSVFTLDQNYPNPFNPVTTIDFSVSHRQTVNLAVFDLIGQKVATLIDHEIKNAGHYSVSFDAAGLTSGMYFYRLQAGNQELVKKMTLVR